MNKQELNHNIRNPLAIIYAQLAVTKELPEKAEKTIKDACARILKTVEDHTNEPLREPVCLTKPHDSFEFPFYYESGITGASDFEVNCICFANKEGRVDLVETFDGTRNVTIFVQHTDAWDQIIEKAEEIAKERINSAA